MRQAAKGIFKNLSKLISVLGCVAIYNNNNNNNNIITIILIIISTVLASGTGCLNVVLIKIILKSRTGCLSLMPFIGTEKSQHWNQFFIIAAVAGGQRSERKAKSKNIHMTHYK